MLNWLQNKTSPVFVVATANDASRLPPELLRKGRWDECWFVDLHDVRERAAIWEIVVAKFGRDPSLLDAATMAQASERLRQWAAGRARGASGAPLADRATRAIEIV